MLNVVYNYRKRFDVFCMKLLKQILIVANKNPVVHRYLIKAPSVNCLHEDYLGWVKDFIRNFINDAQRYGFYSFRFEKEKLGKETLKHYHKFLEIQIEKISA